MPCFLGSKKWKCLLLRWESCFLKVLSYKKCFKYKVNSIDAAPSGWCFISTEFCDHLTELMILNAFLLKSDRKHGKSGGGGNTAA